MSQTRPLRDHAYYLTRSRTRAAFVDRRVAQVQAQINMDTILYDIIHSTYVHTGNDLQAHGFDLVTRTMQPGVTIAAEIFKGYQAMRSLREAMRILRGILKEAEKEWKDLRYEEDMRMEGEEEWILKKLEQDARQEARRK